MIRVQDVLVIGVALIFIMNAHTLYEYLEEVGIFTYYNREQRAELGIRDKYAVLHEVSRWLGVGVVLAGWNSSLSWIYRGAKMLIIAMCIFCTLNALQVMFLFIPDNLPSELVLFALAGSICYLMERLRIIYARAGTRIGFIQNSILPGRKQKIGFRNRRKK